ncbi:hypothetical protein Ccrd_015599 [Cynara cardunculus var. scolymus]|uniref:Uncharacterized protein n=1 Tax=Cynara cardunculus var. scolymus TaxID=59895 RepID=A0A103YBL0_CYNCS|nr:hypothetical protein Ccrd_015599 [Cynara cardunculus var. scolymus]
MDLLRFFNNLQVKCCFFVLFSLEFWDLIGGFGDLVGVISGRSGGGGGREIERVVLEKGSNDGNSSLILADKRTRRKDPRDDFKYYTRGWNVSDDHYISVRFGVSLLLSCCCYCCFRRRPYGYSQTAYALSLGQGRFHNSTTDTLDYVVSQSNDTVSHLNNVSAILSVAKGIEVDQVSLPSDSKNDIDRVHKMIDAAARDLRFETRKNEKDIQRVLKAVLVVLGWILVTATFILCGIFLALHNFVSFNQSGPLVPTLCNPLNANGTDRKCQAAELNFDNATRVWRNYVCQVSANDTCASVGRLTPKMYKQMSIAVNVSDGLTEYGPFLAGLLDCSFVRETFIGIHKDHCPNLNKYSEWIYIGLAIASTAVTLSLVLWILYVRERRYRRYTKLLVVASPPTIDRRWK